MTASDQSQSINGEPLAAQWTFAATEPGAVTDPADLSGSFDWIEAPVPGTVARALAAAGKWSLDAPQPLHGRDYWYRCTFSGTGPVRLLFEGLATTAEVWLNGRRILESTDMFTPAHVDVELRGSNVMQICFRSLEAALSKVPTRPRPRWRPRLIGSQGLRWIRSTLIGHMPGWCPPVAAIGPWRAIKIIPHDRQSVIEHEVIAAIDGSDGQLDIRIRLAQPCQTAPIVRCETQECALTQAEDGVWTGTLILNNAERWWPHTHGIPRLYSVVISCDGYEVTLTRTGFRSIKIDNGSDGRDFRVLVNDVPVFCRGTVWTNSDVVGLSGDRATYAPALNALRAANLNMIRVPGTMVYETTAFHNLCDELGILVWQDFMFANFDYPDADEAWRSKVTREADAFLARVRSSPSLAVLCGGSEVHQQATMLGYPMAATASRLFDYILPQAVTRWRPDVPYIANSPYGGALPFSASSGITHYFGVGAYLRPLNDARRADVKFASECLAIANIPDPCTLERELAVAPFHHPKWKERVPRDQGASWDFEDVRDHYLEKVYSVCARQLRIEDQERYLAASRAVVADIFEATIGEWRRAGSRTSGGLVLAHQDLSPGAGWGILDSAGEPKSPWYALRRQCAPVALLLTDEGLDGLACHIVNDSSSDLNVKLSLRCLRDGHVAVIDASIDVAVASRSREAVLSSSVIGQFFDINSAYRFGPASHDVTIATLHDAVNGNLISQAFHLPSLALGDRRELGLKASTERVGNDWFLVVKAQAFARRVAIDDRKFRPEDNYFNLDPLAPRRIRLAPRKGTDEKESPSGEIMALNGKSILYYGGG